MIGWFSTPAIGAFRSPLFLQVVPQRSAPVFVFLDHGNPCFWNFYPVISVNVVAVESCVNCAFDPTCAPVRATINNLLFMLVASSLFVASSSWPP